MWREEEPEAQWLPGNILPAPVSNLWAFWEDARGILPHSRKISMGAPRKISMGPRVQRNMECSLIRVELFTLRWKKSNNSLWQQTHAPLLPEHILQVHMDHGTTWTTGPHDQRPHGPHGSHGPQDYITTWTTRPHEPWDHKFTGLHGPQDHVDHVDHMDYMTTCTPDHRTTWTMVPGTRQKVTVILIFFFFSFTLLSVIF